MSKCKVIALANQKGGTGKTTTAVKLATPISNGGLTLPPPLSPSENPYFLRPVAIFSIKNARYISLEINI